MYALRGEPYIVAKREIGKYAGEGNKIADCIALFSLDKLEAFPVGGRWPHGPTARFRIIREDFLADAMQRLSDGHRIRSCLMPGRRTVHVL